MCVNVRVEEQNRERSSAETFLELPWPASTAQAGPAQYTASAGHSPQLYSAPCICQDHTVEFAHFLQHEDSMKC